MDPLPLPRLPAPPSFALALANSSAISDADQVGGRRRKNTRRRKRLLLQGKIAGRRYHFFFWKKCELAQHELRRTAQQAKDAVDFFSRVRSALSGKLFQASKCRA